jgi:CheY-like chemotaxis protein
MLSKNLNILLADDDVDDRSFFANALAELPLTTTLASVNDGEQLMAYLDTNRKHLPHVLFLDLSMPRKNGFECLVEIKEMKEFKHIPVVMFSTSFPADINYEESMIKTLINMGADFYIRKLGDFESLKKAIHQSLIKISEKQLANQMN